MKYLSQSVNLQTNQSAGKWCCVLVAEIGVLIIAVVVTGLVGVATY